MSEDINYEIIEALSQIARERNLKREVVLESLEIGLLTAAKRALGTLDPVEVDVDKETGQITLGIVKEIVATEEDVQEPLLQIPLDQAQQIDPETEVGWHVYVDVPITAFGRTAIQAAKQVLQQRIKEAERDKIFEEYLDREGEIITGSVQQATRGALLVNIGRVEAVLPYREQIRRERFRQGDTIRALVKEVSMDAKGPSIILSRGDDEFVRKLFAIEVPEIYEGIVEIKKITRAPGERCKVAVRSHDLRVDAVGACVGMKGSRVQSIVRELNNERIDIVPWSPDVTFFVTKA
ncbi:MAG: transcription termination factor NusA, partial [Candidatus Latescibacteria bacterium]|nr:transcription termination factor NusA [Candidatus Latescibacterota bacterium]